MVYIKKRAFLFLVSFGLLTAIFCGLGSKTGVIAAVSTRISPQVKFQKYSYQDVPLTIALPGTTVVTEDYYSNGELLLNSYLNDSIQKFRGYIQIWRVGDPEEFIKRSKLNSTFHFTSFEHQKIKNNTYHGFLVSWTAMMQDGRQISGRDYLLQKKKKEELFVRISLMAEESVFPEKLEKIADTIVSTLVWK
jgi:hypothetical protein